MTDAIETILDVLTERRDLSGVLFVDAKIREARAELSALKKEKARRIYYQDIVYKSCNQLDRAFGRSVREGTGIVCGTLEHPATEVQDGITALREERDRLREATSKLLELALLVGYVEDGRYNTRGGCLIHQDQIRECFEAVKAGEAALGQEDAGGETVW